MAPSPRYQAVSINGADFDESTEMTNTSAHSAAIATAFEPPQDDADMQEDATEQDRLVTQDPDPARFGIHVQPTTNVRRLLMPHGTDGVFANMSAKPEVGEIKDEHPPTYDEAATDNAPPYWDQTMYLPGGADEVYVDGLAVGHVFGFLWNMIVSMSFQFVGFLLTYILHTTHASKQGSRAGLGITLIQYGFYLRTPDTTSLPGSAGDYPKESPSSGTVRDMLGTHIDYAAYALMIIGWMVLIKSTADFLKVRKLESAVRETQSPGGGAVPVVAHNETPDTAV